MRFVKYLACATMVARANKMYDEEEDLSMLRSLSGNSSGNNTVTTSTTTADPNATTNSTTTTDPNATTTSTTTADPNATTTSTTTMDPNATTTSTTAAASTSTTAAPSTNTTAAPTQTPSSNTTAAPTQAPDTTAEPQGGNGKTEPPQQPAPGEGKVPDNQKVDKGANDAYFANLTIANSTNLTATQEVLVETTAKSVNPFHCGLKPNDAACQTDAGAGNATNSSLRQLSTSQVWDAFDLFCGAFALTNTYAACNAIEDANRDILFGKAAGASSTSMDRCVIQLNLGFKVGSDRCYFAMMPTATEKGVCFENSAAKDNSGARMEFGHHKGCVAAYAPAGVDTYDFMTSTSLKLPKWKLDNDAGLQAAAASFTPAAMEAATKTELAKPETQQFMQTAVIVAVVAINDNPSTKALLDGNVAGVKVNLTESLGISSATATSISNAMGGSLSVAALEDSNSALATAITSTKALLPATFTAALVTDTPAPASTSAATAMMVGSSVVIGLMSLVF